MRPPVVVLHAPGTNRDREAAWAASLAGGDPRIEHVAEVLREPSRIRDARMIILPGGFSYGDDLGAGRVLAARLARFDALLDHVERGRPVLGICNGFQVLVKAGFLPGEPDGSPEATPSVSLTRNTPSGFTCRWTRLAADPLSPCVFTDGLDEVDAPCAHGEGRLIVQDDATLARIEREHLVPLRYATASDNPNGSVGGLASLTNRRGTVLGLMPHPEDHVRADQHPNPDRDRKGHLGLALFRSGLRYAAQVD
jgi:phosphoribosylformylglycinamidine synthase I